jgi:hypothetical protein
MLLINTCINQNITLTYGELIKNLLPILILINNINSINNINYIFYRHCLYEIILIKPLLFKVHKESYIVSSQSKKNY